MLLEIVSIVYKEQLEVSELMSLKKWIPFVG